MRIEFNFSALKQTRWYEYALRFLFGGAISVLAGLLSKRYGPAFGGLFLAFPAIFPASVTLLDKHEKLKKKKAGIQSTSRGRLASALDARGAAMGATGLACFGFIVWRLLPLRSVPLSLGVALAAWLTISVLIWLVWKKRHRLFPHPKTP
jgi:hypothetical protein